MCSLRSRMNISQQETMLDFMDRHKDLAKGRIVGADAKKRSKQLWMQLCAILNADAGGVSKDWKGWTTTWSDWKFHVKKKMSVIANAARQTGGGRSVHKPLSAMDERVAVYVGRERVEGDMDGNAETMPEVEIEYINAEMDLDEPVTLPVLSMDTLLPAVAEPSRMIETPHLVPGPSSERDITPSVTATPASRTTRQTVAEVQQNLYEHSLESLCIQREILKIKKEKNEILKRKEEAERQFKEKSLEMQRELVDAIRKLSEEISKVSKKPE